MIYTMDDSLASQILTNMLDNTPSDIDTREGTPTYIAASAIADELALLYAEKTAQEDEDFIVNEAGEITMSGVKLDNWIVSWGETRKPGGKATGGVFLYAAESTPVPAGTQVFAPATLNVLFATDVDVIATSEGVSVPITAVYEGADGNVSANAITGVVGDLADVLTVTNPTATEGGFDEESDDELATRFLNNRRRPATSGNPNHYHQWATEVPGILDAYVIPVWNGPNTVKVIVLSSNYDAPTPEKVAEVKTYIDSVRPVIGSETDPITVEAATEIPISITADVQTNGMDVQTEYTAAVTAYLQELATGETEGAPGFDEERIVRIVRLQNLLLDVYGVEDISNFTLNSGTGNIVIPAGSVPVLGSVNLNVL
ncbi:baseplate J/gp47 family protein [Pseudobacillus sp. FSL P4-0506]|uniref:baseplate J/gp47 family protein n=1 Tax=Pseudobacillus sp. FSL P4-0506 TaxID=2921576 RepID=UPI0030FAB777